MAYTRGSSEDWDRYATISGDEGWGWEAIRQYLEKVIPSLRMPLLDVYGHRNRTKNGLNQQITIIPLANMIPSFTPPQESTLSAFPVFFDLMSTRGLFKPPKICQTSSPSTR